MIKINANNMNFKLKCYGGEYLKSFPIIIIIVGKRSIKKIAVHFTKR